MRHGRIQRVGVSGRAAAARRRPRFDLEAVLDSLVLVRAEIPEDAFTASILGTERVGNGVVIGADGLVLTRSAT